MSSVYISEDKLVYTDLYIHFVILLHDDSVIAYMKELTCFMANLKS